jgi:hypothetical protein
MVAARTAGVVNFTAPKERLDAFVQSDADTIATQLIGEFLAVTNDDNLRRNLSQFIAAGPAAPAERLRRVRRAAVTLLQSPDYQLC